MTECRTSAHNALKTSEIRTGERYGVTSHGKRNQLKISRLQLAGARGCRVKHLNRLFPVPPRREWLSDWFVFVQLKLLSKKLDSEAHAEIQVFIYMTARHFLSALVQRATDGARRWMLDVRYYSTLTPPLFLCPHRYASVPSHTFPPSPSTWLTSIPPLTFWLIIPFLFQVRLSTALFNIHISIFIIPLHSTLPSKKLPFFCLVNYYPIFCEPLPIY